MPIPVLTIADAGRRKSLVSERVVPERVVPERVVPESLLSPFYLLGAKDPLRK
jgi:hypothetical protein